jgi:aldose 1-epimerase
MKDVFGVTPDGVPVEAFTLSNSNGIRMRFIALGGIILSIEVPDRTGSVDDVTLGYDNLDQYLTDSAYFGAIVGRYANRIANGQFTLDGSRYRLATNAGLNHLHGGPGGFNTVLWEVTPFESNSCSGAVLAYTSKSGEEGYPGQLNARVTYALRDDDELTVEYYAVADSVTPVNLTQHSYFNLAGQGRGDILGHELLVNALRFTPVDETLIPTGEIRSVTGTPFDFTAQRRIGERIDADDEQLRRGGGYDHNFVLEQPEKAGVGFAARLYDPTRGRVLEIETTEPGLQVYTGNSLPDGLAGKRGRIYRRRAGIALETQHFPDSPNQPGFPSTILRPGEELHSRTIYRFSTDRSAT